MVREWCHVALQLEEYRPPLRVVRLKILASETDIRMTLVLLTFGSTNLINQLLCLLCRTPLNIRPKLFIQQFPVQVFCEYQLVMSVIK